MWCSQPQPHNEWVRGKCTSISSLLIPQQSITLTSMLIQFNCILSEVSQSFGVYWNSKCFLWWLFFRRSVPCRPWIQPWPARWSSTAAKCRLLAPNWIGLARMSSHAPLDYRTTGKELWLHSTRGPSLRQFDCQRKTGGCSSSSVARVASSCRSYALCPSLALQG